MVAFFVFWLVIAVVVVVAVLASRMPMHRTNDSGRWRRWPLELRWAAQVLETPMWAAHMWQQLGFASPQVGVPTVHSMTPCAVGARLEVAMPTGQAASDWQKETDAIAAAFGVPKVTVTDAGCGVVNVELVVFDPLADGYQVPEPLATVDLEAVDAGVTENGQLWLLPVLYRNLLFAGVMGAGKSSAVWSLIAGLAPAIKTGLVELWGIDPKVVELTLGRKLFTRFVVGMDENSLALLRELVAVMADRLDRMAQAGSRKHRPTTDEPLILCWIDEVLALTAFAPDKKFREEADRLIRLLLSQGRAAAVSLIVCSQDPSKEIMGWRQMVTTRIGLRMDEPTQTTMVLGQGARDRGARCDEISDRTPGVAYVGEDGRADFIRVRAYLVTDDDIGWLVAHYAPAPRPAALDHGQDTRDIHDDNVFDDDDIPSDGEGHGREAA